MTHLSAHTRLTQLRRVADNMDHVRIPLNAEERSTRQGKIPYWGANSIVDYVDSPSIDGRLVLIGEDGAPFLDPLRPVAFATDEPIWPNNHIHVLRPRKGIDHRFLAYALNSTDFSKHIKGSTREKLNQSELSSIQLSIPSLDTQQSIADYLDREAAEIDTLVAELSTAQELAREHHGAALERLIVTDGPTPSELRRHHPIRKSGTSVNGAPWPAEPGEPGVLKTGAASQREYRPHENKAVIDPIEQARLSTPVEADRVLVNRANTPSNVGAAAYVEHGSDDLFLSDKLWSIDFQGVNEYFAFAMQTRLYQDQASQRAVGTSLSMQNLPYDEFLSIRLPVPSVERQRSICATLRDEQRLINASVSDLDRAIALAKERRAALITAAVTGQIDVTAKRRLAAEQLEDDIKELS